jgi:hypothetical protein
MAWRSRLSVMAAGFGLLAFAAVALLRLPLIAVALVLIPLSIVGAFLRRRP